MEAYVEEGVLINSGEFNELNSHTEASLKVIQHLEQNKIGEKKTTFRLRDWLISRQRYWGCPIPLINCEDCGLVAEDIKNLPVLLPEIENYLNTDGSPLSKSEEFVNVECPKCKKPGLRETDTMDTFVDSSWYFLRFLDSKNSEEPFNSKFINEWLPVDQYIGGVEHAILHLLYSRFFVKALDTADLKNIFVVNPNGETKTINSSSPLSFVILDNDVQLIYPGSIIYIPQSAKLMNPAQAASIWAPIISSIALSLTSLSVLNNNN